MSRLRNWGIHADVIMTGRDVEDLEPTRALLRQWASQRFGGYWEIITMQNAGPWDGAVGDYFIWTFTLENIAPNDSWKRFLRKG